MKRIRGALAGSIVAVCLLLLEQTEGFIPRGAYSTGSSISRLTLDRAASKLQQIRVQESFIVNHAAADGSELPITSEDIAELFAEKSKLVEEMEESISHLRQQIEREHALRLEAEAKKGGEVAPQVAELMKDKAQLEGMIESLKNEIAAEQAAREAALNVADKIRSGAPLDPSDDEVITSSPASAAVVVTMKENKEPSPLPPSSTKGSFIPATGLSTTRFREKESKKGSSSTSSPSSSVVANNPASAMASATAAVTMGEKQEEEKMCVVQPTPPTGGFRSRMREEEGRVKECRPSSGPPAQPASSLKATAAIPAEATPAAVEAESLAPPAVSASTAAPAAKSVMFEAAAVPATHSVPPAAAAAEATSVKPLSTPPSPSAPAAKEAAVEETVVEPTKTTVVVVPMTSSSTTNVTVTEDEKALIIRTSKEEKEVFSGLSFAEGEDMIKPMIAISFLAFLGTVAAVLVNQSSS